MKQEIDKSEWLRGEWDDEPDYLEFVDPDTGYKCEIIRHPHLGSLCGYVYIPEDSPLNGVGYMDDPLNDIKVHWGLTYSNGNKFGFDCAHCEDFLPAGKMPIFYDDCDVYRNISFVKDECISLAKQLHDLDKGLRDD